MSLASIYGVELSNVSLGQNGGGGGRVCVCIHGCVEKKNVPASIGFLVVIVK